MFMHKLFLSYHVLNYFYTFSVNISVLYIFKVFKVVYASTIRLIWHINASCTYFYTLYVNKSVKIGVSKVQEPTRPDHYPTRPETRTPYKIRTEIWNLITGRSSVLRSRFQSVQRGIPEPKLCLKVVGAAKGLTYFYDMQFHYQSIRHLILENIHKLFQNTE